jgi:hypothetical protein
MRRLLLLVLLALLAVPAASPATDPTLHFTTFAHTDLPLGQVYWTGREFLYVAENLGKLETSDASGAAFKPFAAFDQGGEEMRCAVPPNRYWPDGVYCHTPDNRIVRLNRDGSGLSQLARVPSDANSDGALAFDNVGRFGYALLVATGGSSSDGGQVFAIRKDGRVQPIGSYGGPGGAENIAIAPAGFGSAGGSVLIAIDQDSVSGRLLAIDRKGTVTTVASNLGTGINPIAVIASPPGKRTPGQPAAGLYLSDTSSQDVLFTPASGLTNNAGSVLVGTELTGAIWLVRPTAAGGFEALPATTDLPAHPYNLEGAAYIP